jgi:hypothetical protein
MSRYGCDYSLMTGRPKGWRSLFRNVLMVGAVVVISAVSGGVVALDLLGPGSSVADQQARAMPPVQPVSVPVAPAVAPSPARPAASAPTAVAAMEKPQVHAATATAMPAQPPAQPSTATPPHAAPTPNAAPVTAVAALQEPKVVVPESELTFTTGYARRRAVHTAATTGAGTRMEVAHVGEHNQVGRGAKAKPKTTVAHQNADPRRVADARDEQKALAFGDPRANRRAPSQQQGGLFSSNPFGGFFRGLF